MASVEPFFVARTMQVLEVLAFRSSSAPQVADVLRVDDRTARRLLNRLVDAGWLTATEGRIRTYALSLRLVALTAHFAERAPLARAAQPAIWGLHERTGATACLMVPSYHSILCLVRRASRCDAPPHLHELIPAHAGAAGKVLLAYCEGWRERALERRLDRLTERTVTDPRLLRDECRVTKEKGFAVEDGEYRDGLRGIAAPVRDAAGEVVAAVALMSAGECDVRSWIDRLKAMADETSRALVEQLR